MAVMEWVWISEKGCENRTLEGVRRLVIAPYRHGIGGRKSKLVRQDFSFFADTPKDHR